MIHATVKAIECYFPEEIVTNQDLQEDHPDWSVAKIESKTGITKRHYAGDHECSSDMAFEAARKLFESGQCRAEEIDYLILCTQSPDYFLPSTACILQDRLGIPQSSGAFDFNLGCSGFVYGLGLAKGLVETSQAEKVLLLTSETYSKFIHPEDRSTRTLFGDAAAATIVTAEESAEPNIGPFVYGTDGSGYQNLIVPVGGMRNRKDRMDYELRDDGKGNFRTDENLFMDGHQVFNFTMRVVEPAIEELLRKADRTKDSIDFFILHQANKFLLESLKKRTRIPDEKFIQSFEGSGNTVSSTIPIALKNKISEGVIRPGHVVMLVGFGVGYSWGATLIKIAG